MVGLRNKIKHQATGLDAACLILARRIAAKPFGYRYFLVFGRIACRQATSVSFGKALGLWPAQIQEITSDNSRTLLQLRPVLGSSCVRWAS